MKINEKIIIVLLVIILIFQFVLNSNMKSQNNELNNRINALQGSVTMLQGNVSSEVNSIMNRIREENAVIKSVKWDPVEMKDGLVTVRCEAVFNQISKENTTYVLYKAKGTDKWNKTGLEHLEGLIYSVNIDLTPQDSYEYQIFIDGETQYSGNTEEIAPYIYKYADYIGIILGGYNHHNDNSKTHMTINLEPMSKTIFKPLQFQAADVILYSSGKKLDIVNMQLPDRISENDVKQEHFPEYESQMTVSEPMFGIYAANLDIGSYKEVIDRITVKVTYNDGYTVEKEVYPQNEK